MEHATSTGAGVHKEFKERAGFNRRRGAMRRRVHQVNFIKSVYIRRNFKPTFPK